MLTPYASPPDPRSGLTRAQDGLFLLQSRPDIVHGYRRAVLTPNVVEFGRLCVAQGIDPGAGDATQVCARLARALGGVTVVQKGAVDYISDGERTLACDVPGGLKRSGGQGDTLTGALVTFLAWARAYRERLWEYGLLGVCLG